MKILLIDQNIVDPIHREKWILLAGKEDIKILAVSPSEWIDNFKTLACPPSPNPVFPIKSYRVIFPGKENRSFFVRGLLHELNRFRPDVIICFEEPFSFFALQTTIYRAIVAPKAKLVFYTWDNRAKGHDFGYRPARLYAAIQRFVLARAELLLTANEEGTAFFKSAYPLTVKKLYFGVSSVKEERSASAASDEALTVPKDTFIVGYVGRILEAKGIETLIRAAAKIKSKIRVIVVGNGPDTPRLKRIADELALSDKVRFLPGVPSVEVKDLMRRFGVLVIPSRTTPIWKEQFGRVIVEAMSCGVPVVGSTSGAIPEVIGDGGLVFPEGDEEALARVVDRLAEDETLRETLSQNALNRSPIFSAAAFADNLFQYLKNISDNE